MHPLLSVIGSAHSCLVRFKLLDAAPSPSLNLSKTYPSHLLFANAFNAFTKLASMIAGRGRSACDRPNGQGILITARIGIRGADQRSTGLLATAALLQDG